MKSTTSAALAALALLLSAGVAAGQSLAEAAAKEKERRSKVKSAKTYTENELRSAGQGFSPEATADTPAEDTDGTAPKPAAAGAPAETPDEAQARRQKDWAQRFKDAETMHRQYTEEVARLQLQLNSNTTDPYGAGRQEALVALDEAKAKAAEFQQKLSDLEEEGRKNRYRR